MTREKIIIADDHPMFRDGMCRLVRDTIPDADLFEAGSMSAVIAHIEEHGAPDLFLLDLLFPGMNPRESIGSLRRQCPEASIVIVSMVDEEATIEKVMAFGADGYIVKSIPATQMSDAIAGIRAGQFVVARSPQTGLSDQMPELLDITELSARQREILELIRAGKSNKQIGRDLSLSPFTVRNHVSLLFRIFKTQSRGDLARKAGNLLDEETGQLQTG